MSKQGSLSFKEHLVSSVQLSLEINVSTVGQHLNRTEREREREREVKGW